ncbi:hypothetical protein [Hymenobacter sp. B81]|uniref:hypothetical protein n=1 Tax=Hymenobacter sp. B81 TaxID=3344878 RepID=UPI0037DD2DDB
MNHSRIPVMLAATLLLGSALTLLAAGPAPVPARRLTLRLNDTPVAADTVESRFEVAGTGRVLTLALVRRDAPDEPGLTILLDEFKPVPAVYRFKDVLSGHVRQASYRAQERAAESLACGSSEGEVRVTAVDAARRQLTGTFRVVLCATSGAPRGQRLVFEGSFQYPYELR